MEDVWMYFAVREDYLNGLDVGDTVQVYIPALGKELHPCTVSRIQAMASYATWRSTKIGGQHDVKSFDVKVIPCTTIEGLKPGMTAVMK